MKLSRAIESYLAYLKTLASVLLMLKVVSVLRAREMGMTLAYDMMWPEGLAIPVQEQEGG